MIFQAAKVGRFKDSRRFAFKKFNALRAFQRFNALRAFKGSSRILGTFPIAIGTRIQPRMLGTSPKFRDFPGLREVTRRFTEESQRLTEKKNNRNRTEA